MDDVCEVAEGRHPVGEGEGLCDGGEDAGGEPFPDHDEACDTELGLPDVGGGVDEHWVVCLELCGLELPGVGSRDRLCGLGPDDQLCPQLDSQSG